MFYVVIQTHENGGDFRPSVVKKIDLFYYYSTNYIYQVSMGKVLNTLLPIRLLCPYTLIKMAVWNHDTDQILILFLSVCRNSFIV